MAKPSVEEFDRKLVDILETESVVHLLSVPGVYEILSEHYNNQVVRELEEEKNDRPEEDL